jgi:DNA repair exonuclease SbcCD ATPase subunit
MADDLSLLFKLRGDNAQLKGTIAETRAAVTSLKQTLGPELTQTLSGTNKLFAEIGDNLNAFVGQRIPLVGGAFLRVTGNLKGFNDELKKGGPQTAALAQQIDGIAKSSGKTSTEIARFLTTFTRLEGQAKRNDAAFKFFGGSVDLIGNKTARFIPELEKAGTQLAELGAESAGTGAAIASMAGPIGIAVVALVALSLGAVAAARELIDLTKHTAEFQGKMFDLSQATGLGVETLSTLEVAAKTTGGSLDSIAASLGIFQRKLEEAEDPTSKFAQKFKDLGVTGKDTETALRQTLAALAALPEGAEQTALALELFGRGGRQLLAILKETNGDLDALQGKLRDAGILITTDTARSADKLNDELALLDFQLRAASADIVHDLIPVLTDLAKTTGELVRAIRPLLELFSAIAGPALRPVVQGLRGLGIAVQFLTRDYEGLARSIKEANEEVADATSIPAVNVPSPSPVALPQRSPQDAAREAAQRADAVVSATKRAAAAQNQALNELFERGRIDRQRQADDTIATNKRVLDADKARIDTLIKQKEIEFKLAQDGSDQQKKAAEEIAKLQQQQLDAESLFETTSREIRAKAAKERADSRRNEEKNRADNLLREFDRHIAAIEAQIKREEITEDQGLSVIEAIEAAKVDVRRSSLEEQKSIGFLTIENQKELDNQVRQLGQEADRLLDSQRDRRLQRDREAAKRTRDFKLAELDATLDLQRIVAERTISTIEALAGLRIKSEEDAAKEILAIKLGLLDQEIAATEAKLKATSSIANVNERTAAETELNNRLKLLAEERKSIQAKGNRDIEEKRQEDLENERQYAQELADIKERIRDVEFETAREVIRLMRDHFARRTDIVRAEVQLDLDSEQTRHEQAEETLRNLARENSESKKTKEEKLEVEKEINALQEAELARHTLTIEEILAAARLAEKEADPIGRITLDLDSLREFASILEGTIVPLGEILRNTFLQVSEAIGQTVSNWVLLGETGPAVMRKILAQALASIAAEAAVNAIKELALGFATLFFNPAESAAHFTAAGLWGSIAGVAAVAGRGVAGDLFKSKTGTASGDGGRTGSQGVGQLNSLILERSTAPARQQPIHINVNVTQDRHSIVDVWAEDYQQGGITRELTINDGVHGG